MPLYSHSRLSTFEQCPLKYKYKYIECIECEIETSVEAFVGDMVHKTLQKLYNDLRFLKENSLHELLAYLRKIWKENWNEKILIVRKDYPIENWQKLAEKFVTDYYNRYKPFNHAKTIGTEIPVMIRLDKEGKYILNGYIDRLDSKDSVYEIHDYKTSMTLPIQEYLDADRQLALYSIAVKERYRDAKDIRLIWHFLAFDKEVESRRTEVQLEQLKKEIIAFIDKVEAEERFEPKVSKLCDWCEYRQICPKWSHLYKIEQKKPNEYLKDPGVKLVNKYAELVAKKEMLLQELDDDIEKLKEALIEFAKSNNVSVVFGSENKANIRFYENIKFPQKNTKEREMLKELLKKIGKWDEVSDIDVFLLSDIVQQKKWPKEILEKIKQFQRLERVERVYLSKI